MVLRGWPLYPWEWVQGVLVASVLAVGKGVPLVKGLHLEMVIAIACRRVSGDGFEGAAVVMLQTICHHPCCCAASQAW